MDTSMLKFILVNSDHSFYVGCQSLDRTIKPEVTGIKFKRIVGFTYELSLHVTNSLIIREAIDSPVQDRIEDQEAIEGPLIDRRDETTFIPVLERIEDQEANVSPVLESGEDHETIISQILYMDHEEIVSSVTSVDQEVFVSQISHEYNEEIVSPMLERSEDPHIYSEPDETPTKCCCFGWLRNIFKF